MTESDRWLIITALTSAADKWEEWSSTIALPSVALQFATQAKQARDLATKFASE